MKNVVLIIVSIFIFSISYSQNEGIISSSNCKMKILNLQYYAESLNKIIHPEQGNKFVGIELKFDNSQGYGNIDIHPDWIELKAYGSNIFKTKLYVDLLTRFDNAIMLKPTNIEVGGEVKGWICFEVPSSFDFDDECWLRFNNDYNNNQRTDWIEIVSTAKAVRAEGLRLAPVTKNQADNLFKEEKYSEAIIKYKLAITQNPDLQESIKKNLCESFRKIANASYNSSNYEKAIEYFTEAKNLGSYADYVIYAKCYFEMAKKSGREEKLEDALKNLKLAFDMDPKIENVNKSYLTDLYYELGIKYLKEDKDDWNKSESDKNKYYYNSLDNLSYDIPEQRYEPDAKSGLYKAKKYFDKVIQYNISGSANEQISKLLYSQSKYYYDKIIENSKIYIPEYEKAKYIVNESISCNEKNIEAKNLLNEISDKKDKIYERKSGFVKFLAKNWFYITMVAVIAITLPSAINKSK